MTDFTRDQEARYARHIILPEVGGVGQQRLLSSRVLVLGAGGLGSPAALYLAAAGVGTIGVVDFDTVDLTNLQRQVLHRTDDIGHRKVVSAARTIREVNPDVNVVQMDQRLDASNALEVIGAFDLVIDGSDNFPTRYLANDACHLVKRPLVSGAIFQFEGQVSVFDPRRPDSPCYRCVFPHPPPPGSTPSCQEAGVLGVLAGVIGTIQATEAVKLICEIGEPLVGRLLLYDALQMRFVDVRIGADPDCPLCGRSPEITTLIDYERFCGVTSS